MVTVYFGPFASKPHPGSVISEEPRYACRRLVAVRRRQFIERRRAELLVRVFELLLAR
jgi:hypothetical protein